MMSVTAEAESLEYKEPEHKGLPNLVTRLPASPETLRDIDETVRAELVEAGVLHADGKGDVGSFLEAEWIRSRGGEVPTAILAFKHKWAFRRAWRYYVVDGPGIPPAVAEQFHKTWGREVRVDGDCGCPSPRTIFQGFAVGRYHIDTQAGLNAFVQLLASVHQP